MKMLTQGIMSPHIAGRNGPEVLLKRGVRQGRKESMLIFIQTVSHAVEDLLARWKREGKGLQLPGGIWIALCGFADDFLIMATSSSTLAEMMTEFMDTIATVGLKLNPSKTTWCILDDCSERKGLQWNLKLKGGQQVAYQDHTITLGSYVSNQSGPFQMDEAIGRRRRAGWSAWEANKHLPTQKSSSMKKIMKLLRKTVWPVLTWASETWPDYFSQLRKLNYTAMRMVQRMLAPKRKEDELWLQWHRRTLAYSRKWLETTGGDIIDHCLEKKWRYAGR